MSSGEDETMIGREIEWRRIKGSVYLPQLHSVKISKVMNVGRLQPLPRVRGHVTALREMVRSSA